MVAAMDNDAAPMALGTEAADPVPLRWQWARLPALTSAELYAALAARQQVFAVEQHCAFQDADGHDAFAWHLLGWTEERRRAAARPGEAARSDARGGPCGEPALACYLRVLDAGRKFAEPSIGRVLTLPPHRGIGLGRALMIEGLARTKAAWPGRPIRIAAQQRLEAFYASLAFRAVSAPYIEDDIPHVDMLHDGR